MRKLKISVIVPTFNDADSLQICLDALRDQTLPHSTYEVIIVNNSESPLDLKKEFDGYVFVNQAKPGSYSARNKGLEIASADVIAFTDADCVPEPDWLECALLEMERNAVDRIAGHVELFFKSKNKTAVECYESMFAFNQKHNATLGVSVTANLIARREVFLAVGLFDENSFSGGDTEWNERATKAGFSLRYCPNVKVRHPSRHTWGQLKKKVERTMGGIAVRKPSYSLSFFRSICPPYKTFKSVLKANKFGFSEVMLIFFIAYRVKILRFLCLRQLRSGASTPSRS
jgi:GT2 family glycosyltransferase